MLEISEIYCENVDPRKIQDRIKTNFQRIAYGNIKRLEQPVFIYRIREKIRRWHLPCVEARSSISRNLCSLRTLVSPRVQSACFSTIWNRWCTPRRFQKRDSGDNRCLLGCGGCAEDSIGHYARCRAVRRTADSYLALGSICTIDI